MNNNNNKQTEGLEHLLDVVKDSASGITEALELEDQLNNMTIPLDSDSASIIMMLSELTTADEIESVSEDYMSLKTGDVDAKSELSEDLIYSEGYEVGMMAKGYDAFNPPYMEGTDEYTVWSSGFEDAMEDHRVDFYK